MEAGMKALNFETQRTIAKFEIDTYITRQAELFLLDRRSAGLSSRTVQFYAEKLKPFIDFCDSQLITSILDVDANLLRRYMLALEEHGHNKGGQHAHYRALRAFLRWYELDAEPEGWRNPINKTKAPKVPNEILEPVTLETVQALLKVCDKSSVYGLRDAAILLMLLDTGVRASELLALDVDDVDASGSVYIRHGKGDKGRIVYIGRKTRAALKKYLRGRSDRHKALFISRYGERLNYDGLRGIITRRAGEAKLPEAPSLHSFRRAFAIGMLRAGVDVHTLAKLLGHANIAILARYLALNDGDTQAAHTRAALVDGGL
jgi:site-specific recombinase XerD